nr:glutamate--tRNA ligase [Syntrophomonas palmitatica]
MKSFLAEGKRPVLRIKVPESGSTVVKDLIRGRVEFSNRLLDDFIIVKSDGWPTYNFAVVIDDATMKISHVIRAEEHLSNTPKQLLLYEALGFNIPEFAHVSMILAPDRSKLSKRHGATSVQEFRDEGYLPEALINYLALLGWSSGEDTDFWSLQALAQSFNLNNVSRSAAIYDLEKLKWMNGHYLSKADPERLLAWITHNGREQDYLNKFSRTYILEVVKLLQNRLKTLDEFFNEASYFFFAPEVYDEKGVSKYFAADNSNEILIRVLALIEEINPFNAANLENALRSEADKMNLKAAQLIHPTRLALSGKTNTPGLFEVMELLGREACTDRVKRAISYLYHNR